MPHWTMCRLGQKRGILAHLTSGTRFVILIIVIYIYIVQQIACHLLECTCPVLDCLWPCRLRREDNGRLIPDKWHAICNTYYYYIYRLYNKSRAIYWSVPVRCWHTQMVSIAFRFSWIRSLSTPVDDTTHVPSSSSASICRRSSFCLDLTSSDNFNVLRAALS